MAVVKMNGDWSRVSRLLSTLPGNLIKTAEDKVREKAKYLLEQIRSRVESQEFNFSPLSPEYVESKFRRGLDERVLIATHEYLDKLKVKEQGSGRNLKIYVGAFNEDIHEESGLPMGQLAEYLEEGTRRMPARPHIRPTWEDVKSKIAKDIANAVANVLSEKVRGG